MAITPAKNLIAGLNESPSQKEGKYTGGRFNLGLNLASMKVPPKRKGNSASIPLYEASTLKPQ